MKPVLNRTLGRPQLFDDADLVVGDVTKNVGCAQQDDNCNHCKRPQRRVKQAGAGKTIEVRIHLHNSQLGAIGNREGSSQKLRSADVVGRVILPALDPVNLFISPD